MRGLIAVSVALVSAFLVPVQADNSLSVTKLNEIKDATVFVRVAKDKIIDASGSGFLIRVDGDTGYVVTNHHVVNLTVTIERKVAVLVMPRPIGPPSRIRPTLPRPTTQYRTEKIEISVPAPDISLVFGSGTKQERSATAEVVASDPASDLAVLKVKGIKDWPKPINLKSPELRETMPVFIFGFPFGKGLAIGKGNPAITVNRASVSSIRTAEDGQLKAIQVDGSINPGNSGGPLVDENGQLVGIAVAHIRNTTIGLAIPGDDLHLMLAGFTGGPKLIPAKAEKESLEVQVEVALVDPFEKIKSISLYYVPTSSVTDAAKKDGLAKLAESKKIDLRREKLKAIGAISVAIPEKGASDFTCQVAYVNDAGKTIFGKVQSSALNVPAPKVDAPTEEAKTPGTSNPPAVLKFDGERGAIVGVTLKPLPKGKPLDDNALTGIIDELQIPEKAHGAIGRLNNTIPEPKRQAEVARLLEKVATNKDAAIFARADAISALNSWGTPESLEPLTKVLSDPSPHSIHFRQRAMWAMAYLVGDKAIPAVATRITDIFDRGPVVEILQALGSSSEAQALAFLDHQKDHVRQDAAKILKAVGTLASTKALAKMKDDDKNEGVRKEATGALEAIAARQIKK